MFELGVPVSMMFRLVIPLYLMIFIILLIIGGIAHGMIHYIHVENQPFLATLRVFCYSSGTALISYLPIFGGVLSIGWSLALETLGLSIIHGCSWKTSLTSVLVAYAVLVLLFIIDIYTSGAIMSLASRMLF